MNKNKELIKNTIILFIGKFCTQFIFLLLLPIYTKYLITEDYGLVDLIQTYLILFLPIVLLKIDSATFRFLIEERKNEENKKLIITNTIISYAILIIVSIIILSSIGIYFKIDYLSLIILNIVTLSASNVGLQIARGIGNNKSYSIASIITGVCIIVLNIIFVVIQNKGVEGVLLASCIANGACTIFLVFHNKIYKYIKINKVNSKTVKKLLKYSIPMIPNELSWWVMQVSDRTIISLGMSIAANGIYSVSCKFSSILTSVFNIFNMSWHESASLHINDEDRHEFFSGVVNKVLDVFTSICLLILVSIPLIFSIVIGDEYIEAYKYIPILLVSNIFNILSGVLGGIYVAKKMTKEIAKTTVISAVINILINIMFIKTLGIYAAAISTVISYAILSIYRYIDVQKYIKVKLRNTLIFKIIILFIYSTILYYININILNVLNFITIVLYTMINDKVYIRKIFKKIKQKFINI